MDVGLLRLSQGSKNISRNTVWEQASLGPQTLLRLGSSWQVCLSIGMTAYEAVLLYLYPYGLLALQEKTDLKTLVS